MGVPAVEGAQGVAVVAEEGVVGGEEVVAEEEAVAEEADKHIFIF